MEIDTSLRRKSSLISLLSPVAYLLSAVCCLLSAVCRLLSAGSAGCCLLSVCCPLSQGRPTSSDHALCGAMVVMMKMMSVNHDEHKLTIAEA
jgi:hypothetical protein